MPLREYVHHLNLERFGRSRPGGLVSIEDRPRAEAQKKVATDAARFPLAGHTP